MSNNSEDQILDLLEEVGPGWESLLRETHDRLVQIYPEYEVGQLKEKFGGLRIYLEFVSTEEIMNQLHSVIYEAEEKSFKICEMCSKSGKPQAPPGRPNGWIQTVCDECQEKRV